jgi:hypothetical protein
VEQPITDHQLVELPITDHQLVEQRITDHQLAEQRITNHQLVELQTCLLAQQIHFNQIKSQVLHQIKWHPLDLIKLHS